jgi:hypothetical protein
MDDSFHTENGSDEDPPSQTDEKRNTGLLGKYKDVRRRRQEEERWEEEKRRLNFQFEFLFFGKRDIHSYSFFLHFMRDFLLNFQAE